MPEEDEEPEQKEPPTHDPFPLAIGSIVATAQARNGLWHNDHHRYRRYCYRRLRRVRKSLKFRCASGRRGQYKGSPFPEFFTNPKYLELPLMCAERSWAYGMQLKADNATSAHTCARSRSHAVRRFAKALAWAKELERQCGLHGDARAQREAAVYVAFVKATYLVEREQWKDAHAALQECATGYEHLAITAGEGEAVYRAKVKELAPMQRLCTYHLGVGPEAEKAAVTADVQVSFRGLSIPVEDRELQEQLKLVDAAVEEVDITSDDAAPYGRLSSAIDEAQQKLREKLAQPNESLPQLEQYFRELSICANVERSLVLLRNVTKNVAISLEGTKANAKGPDEGVRLCDMAYEELGALLELPRADQVESIEELRTQVRNERLLLVALSHANVGKVAEAVSLFDLLRTRLAEVPPPPADSLARVCTLLAEGSELLTQRVAKFGARLLAQHGSGGQVLGADREAPGADRSKAAKAGLFEKAEDVSRGIASIKAMQDGLQGMLRRSTSSTALLTTGSSPCSPTERARFARRGGGFTTPMRRRRNA